MTTGVCRVLATRRASVVFAAPSGPSMLTSRRRRAAARSSTTDPRFRRAPPGDPPSGRAVGGQKRRYARPAAPRRQDPAERRAGRFHRLVGEPEQQRPARRGLIVERARPRTPCYPSTIPVAPGHDAQRQPAGRTSRCSTSCDATTNTSRTGLLDGRGLPAFAIRRSAGSNGSIRVLRPA